MALIIPTFNHDFDFFEPLAAFRPRRHLRRMSPYHLVHHRPRCHSLLPMAEVMAPLNLLSSLLHDSDEMSVKNEKDKYLANIDLSGLDPKHIKVRVNKDTRMVTVSGKKEEKDENGRVVSFRHFERSFNLPKECSLEKLTSSLDKEGRLCITAPKVEAAALEAPKTAEAVELAKPDTTDKSPEMKEPEKEVVVVHEEEKKQDEVMEVPVEAPAEANTNFEFTINLSGFDPEDMEVVVDDSGFVHVAAKKKEELEDGTVSTREVRKRVAVDAQKYDLDEIASKLNDNGVMTLSVPLKKAAVSRTVPITKH